MSVRKCVALVGALLALGVAPRPLEPRRTTRRPSPRPVLARRQPTAAKTSKKLRKAITSQRMFKHLQALQVIADEHGGNRASGFEGYGASAQYVLTQLRDAGYKPDVQVFSFVTFQELSDPVLREISPTAEGVHAGRVPDDDLLGERRHR